ncbi:MAG: N-acetyltransferase [Minisyncoccia bacterium]|jgi:ribosomal protein S18 acetylase RimI-like enzyme
MLVILERATAKDVDTFINIERSVDGSSIYSAMTNRDETLAEIEKNFVYLIRESGHIVGSVMYEMKTPDHAHISGLAIYPDFQNCGIGKAAMVKILEELKNVPIIDLVTHPNNQYAIKLYKSLGFTLGKRVENYFGDGEPRVVIILNR